jgi:hypothetical protein
MWTYLADFGSNATQKWRREIGKLFTSEKRLYTFVCESTHHLTIPQKRKIADKIVSVIQALILSTKHDKITA